MKTSVILLMTLVTLTFMEVALAGKGHRGRNRKDGCRYDRKSGSWSECDSSANKKTKTMTLKPGQPSSCEPTKTIEKPCNAGQAADCKYERQVSECVDNQKTISFILVSGGEQCRPKEPKQKPCHRGGKARNEKKAERKARRKERRNQRKNDGQS